MSGGHGGGAAASAQVLFDTTIPSVRNIQNLIKDKQEIELKLLTGDALKGTLKWMDNDCICLDGLGDDRGSSLVIWLNAIAFVKYRSSR